MRARMIIFLAFLLWPMSALAGHVYEYKTVESGHKAETGYMKVQDGKLAIMKKLNDGSLATALILDPAIPSMTIIQHDKKRYLVITQADTDKLAAQLAKVRQQLEANIANAPPKRRKNMQQFLDMMAPKEAEIPTLTRTGETATVQGYETVQFQAMKDEAVSEQVWATADNNIPDSQAFTNAMKTLQQLLRPIANVIGMGGTNIMQSWDDMKGYFPVETTTYDKGKIKSTRTLVSVTEADIPATDFAPPEGYELQSLKPGK